MADIPHAPVWMQAPLPAVFIWREGRSTRWQLNEAASCWRETAGLSVPAWRELAEQALALPGTRTELESHGLAWRRVQAAPGWVLWLDPRKPEASHPEGDGGTGTAGMASADVARLSMAREFGRIGFWERDLRSGQARWDAHIFDMFGLDPAAGAPAFEHSTALMGTLQSAGRPFELMVYPGATHGVPGEARQLHLWRTITRFLDRTARAPR